MLNPLEFRLSALPMIVALGFMILFGHTSFAAGKTEVVAIAAPAGSYFTYLGADFKVPKEVPPKGSAFIWPGLQPNGNSRNTEPVGTGVLQPVLGHGFSCQAGANPNWYMSATYHIRNDGTPALQAVAGDSLVNMSCPGGNIVGVGQGDQIQTITTYHAPTKTWHMSMKNVNTGMTVTYDHKLVVHNVTQKQDYALLFFEGRGGATLKNPVTFTNIVLKATHPDSVKSPVICPAQKGNKFKAPAGCTGASSKLEGHVETCTIEKCVVNK